MTRPSLYGWQSIEVEYTKQECRTPAPLRLLKILTCCAILLALGCSVCLAQGLQYGDDLDDEFLKKIDYDITECYSKNLLPGDPFVGEGLQCISEVHKKCIDRNGVWQPSQRYCYDAEAEAWKRRAIADLSEIVKKVRRRGVSSLDSETAKFISVVEGLEDKWSAYLVDRCGYLNSALVGDAGGPDAALICLLNTQASMTIQIKLVLQGN